MAAAGGEGGGCSRGAQGSGARRRGRGGKRQGWGRVRVRGAGDVDWGGCEGACEGMRGKRLKH